MESGTLDLQEETWRRRCGCLRTSEKLKRILGCFPNAPPPTPDEKNKNNGSTCISAYCTHVHPANLPMKKSCMDVMYEYGSSDDKPLKKTCDKSWKVVGELVQLVQLSVTATALALYYLIYCYMQLIYITLRSALYFHNADGAMKITIAVVTITSLVVGCNFLMKMERFLGFF